MNDLLTPNTDLFMPKSRAANCRDFASGTVLEQAPSHIVVRFDALDEELPGVAVLGVAERTRAGLGALGRREHVGRGGASWGACLGYWN